MTTPIEVGAALKTARLERKLSQRAVAEYVGLTRPAYGKYEAGVFKGLRHDVVKSLSEILRIDVGALVDALGSQRTAGGLVAINGGLAAGGRPGPRVVSDVLRIPRMNVVGSMGRGISAPHHEEICEVFEVRESAFRRLLGSTPITGFERLRIITGFGDSMKPTFAHGDLLLVDTGVHTIDVDGVYVASLADQLYIKTMQRRPDGSVLMISDNKKYESYPIPAEELESFRVHGRVVLAWNAHTL